MFGLESQAVASRGELTRERLLRVAEEQLVADKGALDIDRVAAACGISVGGLYHHFASKAALLVAVVEAFHDRYDAEVVYAQLEGDWPTRECERIRRAVRFHYDEPLAPLILARAAADGAVARVDAERLERAARASAANLKAAQREGVLSPDLDCAHAGAMLMGGVSLVLAQALARRRRPSVDRLAEEIWVMVARIVGVDPASPPGANARDWT